MWVGRVCVCVRERERERECLCVRVCVCVRERERVCVCTCVCDREKEREYVYMYAHVFDDHKDLLASTPNPKPMQSFFLRRRSLFVFEACAFSYRLRPADVSVPCERCAVERHVVFGFCMCVRASVYEYDVFIHMYVNSP